MNQLQDGASKGDLPEQAPPNNLPDWSECAMRVSNSDHFAKQVAEGGYGPEADSKLATALHRFIHEYDDASRYRSAWFLHRLELVLNETRAEALAAISATPAAPETAKCKRCGGSGWVMFGRGESAGADGCPDCTIPTDDALNDAYAEGRKDEREEWLAATGWSTPPAAPAVGGVPVRAVEQQPAETALLKVLAAVQRYLPPNGPAAKEAMSKIISIVDPWPLSAPPVQMEPANAWADLWYFVMDEAPMEFERIVTTVSPKNWHTEAHKLMRAKYPYVAPAQATQGTAEPDADRTTLKAHARNLRTESVKARELFEYLQSAAEEIEVVAYREAAVVEPAKGEACGLCGEAEAFTGTCGGGRENPRALCFEGQEIDYGIADKIVEDARALGGGDPDGTLNLSADELRKIVEQALATMAAEPVAPAARTPRNDK